MDAVTAHNKTGVEGRITVYVGGPVEPGRPFLIHTPDMTMKESKPLPGGVVLTSDPAMGVIRHVDAGYAEAVRCAEERGVRVPGLNY